MSTARDEDTVGIVGERGDVCHETLVGQDDAPAVRQLVAGEVAEQAASMLFVPGTCTVQLSPNLQRDKWVGIDLSMGVQHRDPDFLATILEGKDVLDARIDREDALPLGPEFHKAREVRDTQVVEAGIVLWRVQDHFALAVVGSNGR